MAGPFQVPPNSAQEIAPVRLAAAPTSSEGQDAKAALDATAAAISGLTEIGNIYETSVKNELVSATTSEVKSVRDALRLTNNPGLADTYFSESARQDPYIQQVYGEFTKLQNAAKTGRLPQEYAIERMDELTATAVSKRPQYVNEIRSAANQAAGANISSQIFQQITSLTPEQKLSQDIEREAAKVGLTPEDYMAATRQAFSVGQELETLQLKKARGTYQAGDVAAQVRLGVVQATTTLQEEIQRQITAGGVTDPVVLKAVVNNYFTGLRNQTLQNMPKGIAGSVVNQNISTLEAEETRLLTMVDNGSAVKLLTNRKNLFTEQAHEDLRNSGDLFKLYYSMGGGKSGMEALDLYAKFKTNPSAYSGMFTGGEGGGVVTAGLIFDQMELATQIANGKREASTVQEKRLSGYLSALKLKGAGIPLDGENASDTKPMAPQEALRAVDLVTQMGEDYSTVTLNDPKVSATVGKYKETWPSVINHFNADASSLQIKYDALKRKGVITDGMLEVTRSATGSTISINQTQRVAEYGVGARTDANSELSKFLRQANNTLKMGQVYGSKGVIPNSVWTGADGFLTSLTSGAQQVQQTTPDSSQEVINVTRDADGNLIWGE